MLLLLFLIVIYLYSILKRKRAAKQASFRHLSRYKQNVECFTCDKLNDCLKTISGIAYMNALGNQYINHFIILDLLLFHPCRRLKTQ